MAILGYHARKQLAAVASVSAQVMAEGQERGHGRSWRETPVPARTLSRLQEAVARQEADPPSLALASLESTVGLEALLQALCRLAPLHRLLLLGSLWGQ